MADVYLAVQSNRPGSSLVVLINGEPSTTGYKIDRAGGVDLGSAAWDKTYSGARGTQGAKLVGATAQNRLSTWMLQAIGTSEDDLQRLLSQLWDLDEELRHFGGTAFWRSWGSSFLMELEVLDSGAAVVGFDPDLWPTHHIMKVQLGLVTPPYMSGPSMDVVDAFSVDSRADYTFDAGASSDLNLLPDGTLGAAANLASEKRLIHTAIGYGYSDVQVTLKTVPFPTVTSYKLGAVVKRLDASNYLEVYVDDNGTNSRLRIDKVVAGSRTNLATTNLASRIAGLAAFWVRGRIEGNTIYAEHFVAKPSPMGAPTTSTSFGLTATEIALFGAGIEGSTGIVWIPQQAGAAVDDFSVEPFTYRNLSLPQELALQGSIQGDADALAEFVIAPSGGAAGPVWASFGWWEQPPNFNRIWNGDFESTLLATSGWSVSAVTNINGAASSINRITTASQYGSASGQIVCPATSGTGANFRVFGKFRRGVTYRAEVWVHAASATTEVLLKLGNAAANDVASGGNRFLSSSWSRMTVTWTPTADRDDAHFGIVINAATATTFEVDGVMFYADAGTNPFPPAMGDNQSEGRGGFPPIGILEAENGYQGLASNANFRSGFGTPAATPAAIVIDPGLLTPDDHAGKTIAIEVWARLELTAGQNATVILSAQPLSSTGGLFPIYSEEDGSAGSTVTMPSAGTHRRLTRAGTLRLPTDGGRYLLQLTTAGSIDYFVLLPSNSRAVLPSGRSQTSFPSFVPPLVTTEVIRRIRSDGSGTIREPATGAPESVAPGLGGSMIEVPKGALTATVKLSSMVPDDPTSGTADEQLSHSATVHLAVTPRWRLGRSSN